MIESIAQLDERQKQLSKDFPDTIPMSEFYCGFRVCPHRIVFYTLGSTTFSDVIQFSLEDKKLWNKQLLSP